MLVRFSRYNGYRKFVFERVDDRLPTTAWCIAILATAAFPLLQTYTTRRLWSIACVAALIIGAGLIVERTRYPKERLKQLASELIRQEKTFLERFIPLSESEATFCIFHVARTLPSVTSSEELQTRFRGWYEVMHGHTQNIMRDWLVREIEWLEHTFERSSTSKLLSDALNKFLSFASRYEHCVDSVAQEIERAKEDSEPTALDSKTFDRLKAEYESFRTEYDGFVHGFRIFSATLCSELKEAWQDGRIKTAKVLKL